MVNIWKESIGLLCPKCNRQTDVYDTASDGVTIWRRRSCSLCSRKMVTIETVISDEDYKQIKHEHMIS